MFRARSWWLIPVILATQEAEIRRITVQSQPRQIVLRPCLKKYPTQKKGLLKPSHSLCPHLQCAILGPCLLEGI
jgi:hypothetical protein